MSIEDDGKCRHTEKFSVNIYRGANKPVVQFDHISHLFHPITIDESYRHDGHGVIPSLRTELDEWELRGHNHRIIHLDESRLVQLSKVTPGEDALATPLLPSVFSQELGSVLEKIQSAPVRIDSLGANVDSFRLWDETNAQIDGTIARKTQRPTGCEECIFSGPHVYVGNPLSKTPRENCKSKGDYDEIDLVSISEDYLPRVNYARQCSEASYWKLVPLFHGQPATERYRLALRAMLNPTIQRTLIGGIIPPKVAHINGLHGVAFNSSGDLLLASGLFASIVYDFVIRSTGKQNLHDLYRLLPWPAFPLESEVRIRSLRLNCLTKSYSGLWAEQFSLLADRSVVLHTDARSPSYSGLTATWTFSSAIRTDFARRQTLVELDSLAALALDLTEEELITVYRVQFPVLRQYERENLYDQSGRLVPTEALKDAPRGMPKTIFDLAKRYNIDISQPLNISTFTGPAELLGEVETPGLGVTGGIVWEDPKMEPRMKRVYPPPFTKCDREADMRQAYRSFQERLRSQEDAP